MSAIAELLKAAADCVTCGKPHEVRKIQGFGKVLPTRLAADGHRPRPLEPATVNALKALSATLSRQNPDPPDDTREAPSASEAQDAPRTRPVPAKPAAARKSPPVRKPQPPRSRGAGTRQLDAK